MLRILCQLFHLMSSQKIMLQDGHFTRSDSSKILANELVANEQGQSNFYIVGT